MKISIYAFSMNRKIILILILLIAGLLVFIIMGDKAINKKTERQSPESETRSTTQPTKTLKDMTNVRETVNLSNLGFVPAVIKIEKGTRVMWKNKSGKAATVSSDDHPTHILYPPLNLGEFEDGWTVQLVFNEAGTYKYHNHLNSSQKGTVVVE